MRVTIINQQYFTTNKSQNWRILVLGYLMKDFVISSPAASALKMATTAIIKHYTKRLKWKYDDCGHYLQLQSNSCAMPALPSLDSLKWYDIFFILSKITNKINIIYGIATNKVHYRCQMLNSDIF